MFAVIILLLSSTTLCEYIFKKDFGIDQLFFRETQENGALFPGRMSPNSCISFILAGVSLILLDVKMKRGLRPAQFIALAGGLIAFLGLLGYLYGIKEFYGFAAYTKMSVPGIIGFIFIFLGVVFARPDGYLTNILTEDNAGGLLARRTVFVAVLIPLAAEALVFLGERAGFYHHSFRAALHSAIVIAGFLYVALATASTLSRTDEKRKETEQELRESEEEYRELVEGANSIILRMDIKGNITFFNEYAHNFFGFKKGEIMGQNVIGKIVPLTDTAGHDLRAMIDDITAHPGKYASNENENMRSNGERVWISWTNRAILNQETRQHEILCIGNNITKLKEAEAEIVKAKEAAESANRTKSAFLATMSHELRTPLISIMGFSDLLNDPSVGPVNSRQKEYVGYIRESGKHLFSLINDVLDLSKIEAGKMELDLSEFDFKELLERSLIFVKEKASAHHINISIEADGHAWMVKADERKIKQVMINLLSNAIKFTPDNGKVGIEVKKSESDTLVKVWDTGIGIDPKDSGKVFSEFEQISNEYSRQYAGTGLGMPLSKKFVELHGGKMWFESEGAGKGTSFYFTLPITQVEKGDHNGKNINDR
jgi:PAS domain S-box-containing protein